MAEYHASICRSCFHSYVCEQFNKHRDSYNQKCHFYNDHFVPAADVAPIQHGRWGTHSDRPDSLICSVCNCGFDMWKHDPHNYCPNCGAKMDLEATDA